MISCHPLSVCDLDALCKETAERIEVLFQVEALGTRHTALDGGPDAPWQVGERLGDSFASCRVYRNNWWLDVMWRKLQITC